MPLNPWSLSPIDIMKAFHLLLALLFLLFISHVLSSSSKLVVPSADDIIKEILDRKLEAMKQVPGDGNGPLPRISSAVELRVNQNDLFGAAFAAIEGHDTVARNVLCSYLFEGPNVCAAETCDSDLIKLLLARMDMINQRDADGNTPMHIAAKLGLLDIVVSLLPKAELINQPNNNLETPLMLALRNGHGEVALLLLDNKADVDQKDAVHNTPLLFAVGAGLTDIVEIISPLVRDPNFKNLNGYTPLMLALRNENAKIAKVLLRRIDNVDQWNHSLFTPLHYAASHGMLDIVETLLTRAKLVNEKTADGYTPLMLALLNGHFEVAELLWKHMHRIDTNVFGRNHLMGNCLLHFAAQLGLLDTVNFLLTNNTDDINKPNEAGEIPLKVALQNGRFDVSRRLLELTNNIDNIEIYRQPLLHYAIERCPPDFALAVLNRTANINKQNRKRETPIMLARRLHRIEVIRLLLKRLYGVHEKDEIS